MRLLAFVPSLCVVLLLVCAGCDVQPAHEQPESVPPPSPWRSGQTIAVADGEIDADLDAAIAQAQETADSAREQWEKTPESFRTRWAVKWAAPTAEGGVEHLWVQPLHWSPFRIEGLLASDPVNKLVAEHARNDDELPLAAGDLVSLPIEQLADWVFFAEGDPDGPRDGGFTMDVLESRYGKPSERNRR